MPADDAAPTKAASDSAPPHDTEAARREETAVSIALLRAYQGGREEALEELFARYYPRVRRYVKIRMSDFLCSQTEVDDIVQETFAAALPYLSTLEVKEPAKLVHWVATVAENQIRGAVDHFTAQRRDARVVRSLERLRGGLTSSSVAFDPAASQTDPGSAIARVELADIVDECIGRLPPAQRDVLLLRDIAGASWDFVGQTLGERSTQAFCNLHARATLALMRLVKPYLGDERSDGG